MIVDNDKMLKCTHTNSQTLLMFPAPPAKLDSLAASLAYAPLIYSTWNVPFNHGPVVFRFI